MRHPHLAHPVALSVVQPCAARPAQRLLALFTAQAMLLSALWAPGGARATTPLADQPLFSSTSVPGNLALALSVEYPTAISVAHLDSVYDSSRTYLGYFDPAKCYLYSWNSNETLRHFYPSGVASNRVCISGQDSKWAGNFLNWATMQTVDPFRWALTGGYRAVDTTSMTLIEKAWASGQGGTGNFPDRSLGSTALVAASTPFGWNSMAMRIQGLGNKMRFTRSGDVNNNPTAFTGGAVNNNTVYEVSVRVKVCDTDGGAGPLEANCTAYPAGNYKPTGLIQQYSNKIRYSAFGYLNDSNMQRDGGVLRARQKFVGPTQPVPNSTPVSNTRSEWAADTGIQLSNPDSSDAGTTSSNFGIDVSNSGVINYLNKFGQITPGSYKTYDPVSELYYATIRYYKNLGNVPEWTSMTGADASTKTTWADGFPVITSWDDPIQYSCQKNFVLGIGDVNTWTDKNVPGNTGTRSEPGKPSSVIADSSVDARVATDKVGALHGMGANLGSVTNNQEIPGSYYIAGLAYDSNTKDIRPDTAGQAQTIGKQTVQTYWLDVLEYSNYSANNPYYLAAKYGGFRVPKDFDPYARSTDIPVDWWSLTGEQLYGQTKPDNYFVAARPDDMVAGLTKAFSSIADQLTAYTTSFATALPQFASNGTTSFSAQYDAGTWTGELSAATTSFASGAVEPSNTLLWNFSSKLAVQASGSGWNTGRRIVTFNTSTSSGVPFRINSISASQQSLLNTVYRTGDSADYLNYLRGDPTHEEKSTASGSAKMYRNRSKLLGDIVGAKPRIVMAPASTFSSAANPGYALFKSTWAARRTMVYIGTNAGLLHAVDGSSTGSSAGTEVFAYVPGALYAGPTNTPASNGLVARGDPDFAHRYFVDATPTAFDIDFGRTVGGSGTDWRTVLVGGLGKGGKSYYAIDITDPSAMGTETAAAAKVLWEFSHPDLGYTYGEPVAVKTRRHGWVLIFGSGYNNTDGKGYFFIVNPRTGVLIERIGTGVGSASASAGLAHVQAFVLDRSDNTADAAYAGDLQGNIWRLDLTGSSGNYGRTGVDPNPVRLATLTDAANQALPVTSKPLIVVQPVTNRRWVTVGTGRLLDVPDIASGQTQAMHAIIDGTGLAFNATAPIGFAFPLGRSHLKELTDLTQPVTFNLSTEMGWTVSLGNGTGGQGWRVISDPTAFYGVVEFTAMLPSGDACNPSGTSRIYAIDLGTGQSNLAINANSNVRRAYSDDVSGLVTEQRSLSVAGKRVLLGCNSTGTCKKIDTPPVGTQTLRRLNWRELQLAN